MSEVPKRVDKYPETGEKPTGLDAGTGIARKPVFLDPTVVASFHPQTLEFGDDLPEALQVLLRQARQYRLLRPDEEVRLAQGIERGNLADKELLINSNIRYVAAMARDYRGLGMDDEELVQNGLVGLIRAAEKFDHRKGFRFSTYARRWIRNAILRPIDKSSDTAEVAGNVAQKRRKVGQVQAELSAELGREPTDGELIAELDIDQFTLDELRLQTEPALRLDAIAAEDSRTSLGELIAGEDAESVLQKVAIGQLRPDIGASLNDPSIRAVESGAEVIILKYGLLNGEVLSAAETGLRLGLTQAQVEHIERTIFTRLKQMDRIKQHAA